MKKIKFKIIARNENRTALINEDVEGYRVETKYGPFLVCKRRNWWAAFQFSTGYKVLGYQRTLKETPRKIENLIKSIGVKKYYKIRKDAIKKMGKINF